MSNLIFLLTFTRIGNGEVHQVPRGSVRMLTQRKDDCVIHPDVAKSISGAVVDFVFQSRRGFSEVEREAKLAAPMLEFSACQMNALRCHLAQLREDEKLKYPAISSEHEDVRCYSINPCFLLRQHI